MQNLQENPTNRIGLYIVQEGDTVESIAMQHNVPPILLICSNSLKCQPQVGSMLVVPKCNGKLYTVQVGDTIESLCQKFSIDKETFQQKNGCSYIYPSLLVLL